MEKEPQVFSSNITRSAKPLKNNLTDLLKTSPATPVVQKKYDTRNNCDFKPKNDKHYEPKRRSKLKVSTVRAIRNLFEKDVYSTLLVDLEKQQNVLLRKIKAGSSRDENTKSLTRNMFKCDKPVSRSAWQMLTNLNPEEYAHATQFVLWNGKRIRVNGSKGGSCKFLCKYDLGVKRIPKIGKSLTTIRPLMKKKGLLQNSLSINFKPGPLRKKLYLDHSYQKYHVGGIELQNLPKPALEIHPTVGKTIDPTISRFLHNVQQVDGTITEKWAEFSVSVLATIETETITQNEQECCVTFDLDYRYNQQRILMRRDVNSEFASTPYANILGDDDCGTAHNIDETSEIKSLLDKIIDSVEISLEQDDMYTEEEPRDVKEEDLNSNVANIQSKETRPRSKRELDRNRELERLDVTIIRLGESADKNPTDTCLKAYCSMGCVCQSLERGYNFKRHCGRILCMFECKCDFSKYKVVDSFERHCSDLLPDLLKFDSEMNSKMAKEEQKFHHTVIVTPENSMLLKSKRRDWKSSRKYADFFSSMSLKNGSKPENIATLVLEKINLPNVEPWCMVHGLYKCFCKGIFTANSIPDVKTDDSKDMGVQEHTTGIELTDDAEKTNITCNVKTRMSSHRKYDRNYIKDKHPSNENAPVDRGHLLMHEYVSTSRSARVKPYKGRKFTNGYYINANRKISDMEQHDDSLRKRLMHLYSVSTGKTLLQARNIEKTGNVSEHVPAAPALTPAPPVPPALPPLPPLTSAPSAQRNDAGGQTMNTKINLFTNRLPDKEKLVAWLEVSYKQYKQRTDRGIPSKISLEPPLLGKLALYPWDFILGRYRDKKNLFLITTKLPFRIFMAVDPKNPFFRQCMNINDIRFADLPKYPATVKNLLANAKDLKDNFCILWGLSHCWELIGSVTKVGQPQENTESIQLSDVEQKDDYSDMSSDTFHIDSEDSNITTASTSLGQNQEEEKINSDISIDNDKDKDTPLDDSSRWFVMMVENDFEEIQFYNKGFFVKLESIMRAIHVARASRKTVRLSSQKCVDSTGPQFGIYAIPNDNESCVFVGPYEKNEPLGIETVKNMSDIQKLKRTKGVWITTKKLENFNVIDDPLSFMPPKNVPDAEMMTLAGDSANTLKNTNSFVEISKRKNEVIGQDSDKNDSSGVKKPKILKPIKITKTNRIYQLAANGTLKEICQQSITEQNQAQTPAFSNIAPKVINTSLLKLSDSPLAPLLSNTSNLLKGIPSPKIVTIVKRPVAEIAPHVKHSNQSSKLTPNSKDEPPKKEKGMFILKPEEINKRLMQFQMPTNLEHLTAPDSEIDMDIEKFLATAEECEAPNDDILIISDDETDLHKENKHWKDVWIECKNIDSLGWIRGRKNNEGLVSFEFPGFKYTEFYMQEEAFAKLNQVLSRKIYIPKSIALGWQIVESEQNLSATHMLTQEELGSDFSLLLHDLEKRRMLSELQGEMIKSQKRNESGVSGNQNYVEGEQENCNISILTTSQNSKERQNKTEEEFINDESQGNLDYDSTNNEFATNYGSAVSQKIKKKLVDQSKSKTNASKIARLKGYPYRSPVAKKRPDVEGRKLKPPCSCKSKCYLKIAEEQRLLIFNEFWKKFESWDQRRQFIASSVKKKQKRLTKTDCDLEKDRRKFSFTYSLTTGGLREKVMTKRGIRHKQELLSSEPSKKDAESESGNLKAEEDMSSEEDEEPMDIDIAYLEAESQLLEDEGEALWDNLKNISPCHSVIGQGLKEIDGLREEIAARLQSMVSDS